jgi:hypothetical protein
MFLKIHRSPGAADVVAVCDCELINKTLRHGEVEISVSEGFYGTEPADEAAVRNALQNAANINLMGKRAVSVAVDLGLIDPDSCIMLGDVPHAQIFRV